MKVLEVLARVCAILAGLLLVFITVMTCVSIVGRDVFGKAILGDFELSGAAAGAAIALFMPWCQIKRGNIIVDFFTSGASERAQAWMDRLGALLLGCVMGLMAWRTTLGGINAWTTQSGTMMLGFPEWIVYVGMVPPLALAAAIGLYQALFGLAEEAEHNPELSV